jgi:WhiB family transcriptional regulator, redox-sensing transcriptional regulator
MERARRRPQLSLPPPSWMQQAACASHGDPDLWFPEHGQDEQEQQALGICAACPVRTSCLAYVLCMPPQPGIWGGTTEDDRIRERRRQAADRAREAS